MERGDRQALISGICQIQFLFQYYSPMGETNLHALNLTCFNILLLLQCSHRVGGSKSQQLRYTQLSSNTQLLTHREKMTVNVAPSLCQELFWYIFTSTQGKERSLSFTQGKHQSSENHIYTRKRWGGK